MNKNNIKTMFVGTFMSAAIAAGITACSDDHFDINSDVLGKQTIWENIQSDENLSQYADILKRVNYSTTEEKTTKETYADLFNGEQTFTVWAPVNGSFDYDYYDNLLKSGIRDSIYKVERELIRNNMTRFSHVVNGNDSIKLDLFNMKAAWLNCSNATFKGQAITKPNIGSSNGVLHILSAPAQYQPNLYEFLATRPELDSINAFIKSYQITEFDEKASTQGPTIDGQITYVDSITYIDNEYTRRFMGAKLEVEDSNYVMILPTNEAWEKTLEKTQKLFKFKASYKQDIHTQTEQGVDTTIIGKEIKFTQAELDSMVNLFSKNAICQDLAFNANWQYEQIPITSIADIRAAEARKDSLRSTAGEVFKYPGTLNETNGQYVVEANFVDMFGGKDPIETSNGYAYIVDEFNYPFETYAPTRKLDATIFFESNDNQCSPSVLAARYDKPKVVIDGETVQTDSVFSYRYLKMAAKATTSQPGAFFMMDDVLSSKYDIYVVIGYNTDYNLQNKFRAYISYDTDSKRVANEALKNPNEDAVDAAGESIYGSNNFVNRPIHYNSDGEVAFTDTICIAKDFEFPISYYGIGDAYPTIQIKSNFTTKEKSSYTREIWVNAIIMKSKER